MSNYMAEAFAPAEARYHAQVVQATWGHLAPIRNLTYRGHVVFAVGCYDSLNPLPLETDFKTKDGETMDDNPWFFDALTDLLSEFVGINHDAYGNDTGAKFACEAGGVYRWEGTFRNNKFSGKLRRLQLVG